MDTWFDLLREKLSWGAHGTVDVLPRDFACYLMAGIPQRDARRVRRRVESACGEEASPHGRLTILQARMNRDVAMDDA